MWKVCNNAYVSRLCTVQHNAPHPLHKHSKRYVYSAAHPFADTILPAHKCHTSTISDSTNAMLLCEGGRQIAVAGIGGVCMGVLMASVVWYGGREWGARIAERSVQCSCCIRWRNHGDPRVVVTSRVPRDYAKHAWWHLIETD